MVSTSSLRGNFFINFLLQSDLRAATASERAQKILTAHRGDAPVFCALSSLSRLASHLCSKKLIKKLPLSKIVILSGPTASGKSELGLELALKHPEIEIINADSLLVYRGLDIGTAKPSQSERGEVPHHLVDIRGPDEPFTAGDFVAAVDPIISDILSRGKRALIVGGTGFYLKALLYGLWDAPPSEKALREKLEKLSNSELFKMLSEKDPKAALRIGENDRYRLLRSVEIMILGGMTPTALEERQQAEPDPRFLLWVIDRPREELFERIRLRTARMLKEGLVDEVRNLLGIYPNARPLQSVGYAQVGAFLRGQKPGGRKPRPGFLGLEDEINLATQRLVKKQRTYLRGLKSAQWFQLDRDRAQIEKAFEQIEL